MNIIFTPEDVSIGKINLTLDISDSSNVIVFPKTKQNSPPQTLEEIKSAVSDNQTEIAIDIAYMTMINTLMDINESGFNVFNDPRVANDIMLCVESIKSLIMRSCNIDHPLQMISQEIIEIEDPASVIEQFTRLMD